MGWGSETCLESRTLRREDQHGAASVQQKKNRLSGIQEGNASGMELRIVDEHYGVTLPLCIMYFIP